MAATVAGLAAQLERTSLTAAREVEGRVGRRPSREFALFWQAAEGLLHIRCLDNPEFWLELDTATNLARGHFDLGGVQHRPDRHAFAVLLDGRTACVYHSACAAFWLHVTTPV